MKFTLIYEGELPSNGDKKTKWDIRKKFHPQLEELWLIDETLKLANRHRYIPTNSTFIRSDIHHSLDEQFAWASQPPSQHLDLLEPIEVGGRKFIPLVRDSLSLRCSLKIQYLRREPPGRIFQGGDIDNRIKTLFDAFQVPDNQQVVDDETAGNPIYCLVENDRLITGLEITSHQLLSKPNLINQVHMLIEVEVRVSQSRGYNQMFLGG